MNPNGLCEHCGTPLPPDCTRFCCAGCEHVHNLLLSSGLDNFYQLRGNATLAPVPPHALRERDWEWLAELISKAESSANDGTPAQLDLAIQGMSCLGCVWLIESVFTPRPGAQRIEIHATRGSARLTWQRGVFDVIAFARELQQFGYLLGKPAVGAAKDESSLARRTGLCGAFAMNAMAFSLPSYLGMSRDFMFASWFDLIAACSATLALLVGGTYFARRSLAALRHGVLHIDTPITLGIAAAYLGSIAGWLGGVQGLKYFDFVAIFIFLMLAGRWLQQAAVERNRRRLLQNTTMPESVTRIASDGTEERIAPDEIKRGDTLIIKSGEVFPTACELRSTHASISLEWINGESEPRERTCDQLVPSGALNIGARSVEVECREAWSESLLHQLMAAKNPGAGSAFMTGLLRGYLIAVIMIGIAGFIGWQLAGSDVSKAAQIMISVFVVSCPCALGVAAPFADDLAASWMERLGVFVRAPDLWQKLARVRSVVFDKTGTLTMENPQLVNTDALNALKTDERDALRRLVSGNLHPVSRSLFEALGATPVEVPRSLEEVAGQGVKFTADDGVVWSLGRPGWVAQGDGDVVFAGDGQIIAAFRFREALRPETLTAFDSLRSRRFAIHLLSGDREQKVAQTALKLGLAVDEWHAELTPAQKAEHVAALSSQKTLYIGDGANDSLAFEKALCAGSPVTGRNFLEHKADFYFLGNSLRFVPRLLEVARLRQRAVRRVFGFALSYNIATVILSLTGGMSPLLAAVLMPLSSVATLAIARISFGRSLGIQPARTEDDSQNVRGAAAPFLLQSDIKPLHSP